MGEKLRHMLSYAIFGRGIPKMTLVFFSCARKLKKIELFLAKPNFQVNFRILDNRQVEEKNQGHIWNQRQILKVN